MATGIRDNRQVIDYLARDYDSFRQTMIDLIPSRLPEWTDRSEADFGVALIELVAYTGDILSYYVDRQTNECFPTTAQERRSVIQHLRLIGYEMAAAAPAAANLSVLFDKSVRGTVEIRRGDQFATVSSRDQRSLTFEYVEDKPLIIDLARPWPVSADNPNFLEVPNVIPVREGKTIVREIMGISNSSANQVFALAQPNVLRDSIEVTVEPPAPAPPMPPWRQSKTLVFGGRAFTPEQLAALEYQERIGSSLGFSRAADLDFATETDENEVTSIRFGDDQYGKIPPPGSRLVATYRVGGGSFGNVGARQINVIAASPQLQLLGLRITNRKPASGGADRESIEQAVRFSPTVFTSMNRAVTADDFEAQARLFPGVSKARAVARNWNTVALYVAPKGTGEEPSDILRRDLLAYFEDKRMLTVQIAVESPDYRLLEVEVEVGVLPYFRSEDVKGQATDTIRALYEFNRADFGQTLYVSKLFEALEALDGVEYVNVMRFGLAGSDGEPADELVAPKLKLKDSEIAVLASGLRVVPVGGVAGEGP